MSVEAPAPATDQKFRIAAAYLLDRFESYSIVLDSSIVVGDIRWKVIKRTNPAVRSLLDRALDSSLLIPFVPDVLSAEVEENLHELSERHDIPVQRFLDEWEKVKPRLQIVPIADTNLESIEIRDSTDAPFIAAQRKTNASSIVTTDDDIHASDAPSAGRVALEQTTALQAALVASIGAAFMCGFVALSPLLFLGGIIWGIYALARRRPGLALVLLAITGVLTYLFWDRVKAAFKRLFSTESKDFFFEFMGAMAVSASEYKKKADEAQLVLETTLSIPPKTNT